MTVNYVYLGYGTTDENGECKLDHDANGDSISHSYTGTGAGKIDVVASLDSRSSISDSSLVSETFVVWDTLFFDTGLDESKNSQWNVGQGSGTKELTENGLKISNPSDTTRYDLFVRQTGKTTNYYWNAPFCVEVDITEMIGNASRLQIFSNQTSEALNVINSIGHWKIIYDGTTVTITKDNGSPTTYTKNMPNARIGFYIVTGGSITYKNFKIYSI